VSDDSRIDDLERRIQNDPASIAFAQLAEEYRRAGRLDDAIATCRTGLAIHPSYTSARVTLGRALLECGQLDDARAELETVLNDAPENLAALRAVAQLLHRRGALIQALARYRQALALAPNDPELDRTAAALSRHIEERSRLDDRERELRAAEATTAAQAAVRRTVVALEHFLDAIHVARAQRRA
jgi:tetratricopeptide (TPR) repeat protein